MRAVVIATGYAETTEQFSSRHSPPLLPLLDRPFLQHVIEYLAGMGVPAFDIILSNDPEKYEALLGDGTRWGCSITVRLARDAARPYHVLKQLAVNDERLLLAHADTLPAVSAGMLNAGNVSLFCTPDSTAQGQLPSWSGWALLGTQELCAVPADADRSAFEKYLRSRGAEAVAVPKLLSVRSYADLLAAQRMVLAAEFSGLLYDGCRAADEAWLSRNVSLHPTVRIIPPVYIGANCRIGSGVRLGPGAVVGSDCILDAHCSVINSAVLPGSYVGEMLELEDCIVDRNVLVNTRIGGMVNVSDAFILGSIKTGGFKAMLQNGAARVLGVLLLLMFAPLLLVTMLVLKLFRTGPVLFTREAVRLPAADDPLQWRTFRLLSFSSTDAPRGSFPWLRHFFLCFLPALVHVARGSMHLAGVAPLGPEQMRRLPHDWQALHCSSKAGIITETLVVYGPAPSEDEIYAAEAFYAVSAGPAHDARLILKYCARLFRRL
jgi:hypothetical protein